LAYLKEADLRNRGLYKQYSESTKRVFKSSSSQANRTIFLSHSHKDKDLVDGLKDVIVNDGYSLYIDWEDSGMPEITSRETAEKIKMKIEELDYFWVLATTNAINSKWVPWEIGIADAMNDKKIFIIPVTDQTGKFKGNEYLQLYKRLIIANSGDLAVFLPNETNGKKLSSYIGQGRSIYG
jgi:hypothetical protein